MGSQGFKNPNQFRDQLDKQLKGDDKKVSGYRPVKFGNTKQFPPPKKP